MDKQHELRELTETFLRAMKLSLDMEVSEQDDCYRIDLRGADSYLLQERQGNVLEALQILLAKVAETRLGLDKRVVVDCEGFRQGRDQELIDLALSAADKVRRSGQPVELAPMNPYERRLVHLAIADEAGVATESQGDGFLKRILITPA